MWLPGWLSAKEEQKKDSREQAKRRRESRLGVALLHFSNLCLYGGSSINKKQKQSYGKKKKLRYHDLSWLH